MKWRAPAGKTEYERLWSRVHSDPKNPTDGCWRWQGEPHPKGYARIQLDGHVVYVHRHLWQEQNRPLNRYEQLAVTCGNVACVNPRHWKIRTPSHAG